MNEFAPQSDTSNNLIEDADKAREIAESSDAMRSDAAKRRFGSEMIKDMIGVDMTNSEINDSLIDMSKGYGSEVTSYTGKPDEMAPRGAQIAESKIYSTVGMNGGSTMAHDKVTYHLDNEARVLDEMAEREEAAAAKRYDTRDNEQVTDQYVGQNSK